MKEFKVEIPKGYEIDEKNSTLGHIKFKKVKKDITERVKSVEDACKELGEDNEQVKQLRLLQSVKGISGKVIANQELIVVTKALNEDWIPNFKNHEEYKWCNYFQMSQDGVFSFICVNDWHSYLYVPAPYFFKTKELALYCKSQFLFLYEKVYTI